MKHSPIWWWPAPVVFAIVFGFTRATNELPTCQTPEVLELVREVISEEEDIMGVSRDVRGIGQLFVERDPGLRVCEATFEVTVSYLGELFVDRWVVGYEVEWDERLDGSYWVYVGGF